LSTSDDDLVAPHVLRKGTNAANYVPRLRRQIAKQITARESNSLPWLQIPKVLREQTAPAEKSYFADMEFVNATDFVQYFQVASRADIDLQLERILAFVHSELDEAVVTLVEPSRFEEKLRSTLAAIEARQLTFPGMLGKRLESWFQKQLAFEIRIPLGRCHGDLTLSNILFDVNHDRLVFIDYLDTYLESPLQDIVKLRQDTQHRWSSMFYALEFDAIRLGMVMDYLDQCLQRVFSSYDWYRNHYSLLQVLNFLRIMPYATNRNVVAYLFRQLDSLTSQF
jgi:hypothetical protein